MKPIGQGLASHPALINWLAGGRRGISSNTMVQHLTGLPTLRDWRPDHPHDPDDLNRCLLLLREVPLLRVILHEMSSASRAWASLIEHWEEIESCFLAEAGLDWCNGSSAPKTYELMRKAIDKAKPSTPPPPPSNQRSED